MHRLFKISFFVFSFLLAMQVLAQDSKPEPPEKEVKEETIDSIWGFTKYLGSKLGNELKTRLNLEDEKQKTEEVKVNIKIGRYKVQRIEQRPA